MSGVSSRLRERIVIQQLSTSADGYGGQIQNWTILATLFAEVQPLYSIQGEHSMADMRTATAGYRVNIHARSDVKASMRILWKTHVLAIHSIHEQGEMSSMLTYEENI